MTTAGDYNRFTGQVAEGGLATALSPTQLSDSAKRWAFNQWKGRLVRLRGGNNDQWTTIIVASDASTLYFQERTPSLPESVVDTSYEILTVMTGAAREASAEGIPILQEILQELKHIHELLEDVLGQE